MAENPLTSVSKSSGEIKTSVSREKLPVMAHILCGWPLILVVLGGCIGGGLGGLAYGINVGIYKSNLAFIYKLILIVLSGLMAFVLWLIVGASLLSFFNK